MHLLKYDQIKLWLQWQKKNRTRNNNFQFVTIYINVRKTNHFFVFLVYTLLGLFILKVGGGAVPAGDRKIHSMIASN